jgi:Asp-tRNA(Asn)/Glu-tRNA(Gln) amidotransferase A subunit family amidase
MLWACLAIGAGLPAAAAPAMLGADGLPRGVQIVAASFEDRTAVACAAMLDALGASFSPADGLSAMARLTSNAANASCKLGELA